MANDVTLTPDQIAPAPFDAQALITKAIEHNVSIETLERLVALREKLQAEAARTAFFTALSAFQGDCPVIVKDKQVSITPREGRPYSYRYAPLDRIISQVAGLLEQHGFSYTLNTRQEEAQLTVICTIHHTGGHSESSEFTVPIDKGARMNVTQQVGAARTFCMRYAFCNAVGIMTGDEDTDALEQEAKDKFKKLTPAVPTPTPTATELLVQSLAMPVIPAAKHRALEAAITEYAAAYGLDAASEREKIKEKMGRELGVEHFPELNLAQYEQIMQWINQAYLARRKKA